MLVNSWTTNQLLEVMHQYETGFSIQSSFEIHMGNTFVTWIVIHQLDCDQGAPVQHWVSEV